MRFNLQDLLKEEILVMNEKFKDFQRIRKVNKNPLRTLVLWGWDSKNNPSYAILFGEHESDDYSIEIIPEKIKEFDELVNSSKIKINKESTKVYIDEYYILKLDLRPGSYHIFEENVNYIGYQLIKGKEKHVPSFLPYKLIKPSSLKSIIRFPGIDPDKYSLFQRKKGFLEEMRDDEYIELEFFDSSGVSIPYFAEISYDEIINIIKEKNIQFTNFKLASSPNEILELKEEHMEHYDLIINVFSNPNLYMRRKFLEILLNRKPSKEIYIKLLELGSSELISGLFLELAKSSDPILENEAKKLIETEINWVDAKFARGIKRCVKIYLNSIDSVNKTQRIKDIRAVILDQESNPTQLFRNTEMKYTFLFNYIKFKNYLQEAECYDLPDVIGKLAYYIDTQKLANYIKKSLYPNTFEYFYRYIKRILNDYFRNNKENYLLAITQFLISYKEYDYYEPPGNFGKNKILLEHTKVDTNFVIFWNDHLDVIIEIIKSANIDLVYQFCANILDFAPNASEFLQNLPTLTIIDLISIKNEFIVNLFKELLTNRIEEELEFNPEIMIALMTSENKTFNEMASKYFERTRGVISPEFTIRLIFSEEINKWIDIINQNLLKIDGESFFNLITKLIEFMYDYDKLGITLLEGVIDLLMGITDKINGLSQPQKFEIINKLINLIKEKAENIPDWFLNLAEELIFSISLDDLESIAVNITFKPLIDVKSIQIIRIYSILKSISKHEVFSDSEIIEILDFGSARMVNTLISVIDKYQDKILNRYPTLLLFFESDVMALNIIASEIFEKIYDNKSRDDFLSILIDSPVNRAYSFGLKKLDEIYEEKIPSKFMFQLLEHSSPKIKAYISNRIEIIVDKITKGNNDLFKYYIKTLLLLPNLYSKSKNKIYQVLPQFTLNNKELVPEIEELLTEIGGSNIKIDTERALIALVKIRERNS